MRSRVAIACAGLHAGVLIETLGLAGGSEFTLFDDDRAAIGTTRFGAKIAGPLADIEAWARTARFDEAMIGTANVRHLETRQRVFHLLKQLGLPLATAVHPRAYVSASAAMGEGTYIGPMTVIHSRTAIGRNVCIYTGSTIDHDNIVEDHVFVSPGVHTAGQVTLETGVYLGPGTVVGSGCRIGRDSIVGAGAVVLSDIPPRSVAFGAPASVVKSIDEWIAGR